MMIFVFNMMKLVLKMMNFAFKMAGKPNIMRGFPEFGTMKKGRGTLGRWARIRRMFYLKMMGLLLKTM